MVLLHRQEGLPPTGRLPLGIPVQHHQRDGHILGRMFRAVKNRVAQTQQGGRREQAQIHDHVLGSVRGWHQG